MRFVAVVWVFASAVAVAAADANPAPPRMPGAVEAVRASLEVEKHLLDEDLALLRVASARRAEAAALATEAFDALDAMLRAETPPDAARLESARKGVADAERARSEAMAPESAILDRVVERKRKIVLLEERVAGLQSQAGEAAGPLSAAWEVTLMPSGQRGTMFLTQNGALVSGTYALDGGWSGSVRGTVVNRKVLLERIDAKVGRWGTLEGYLSADGRNIRGTWSRMELAGTEGAEGQWIATRSGGEGP
jgi:hypothetical protein